MGKRTVTVIGSGSWGVTPDVVRLDLRVGHEAADVAAALAGASEGIAVLGEVVRDQGVADPDIRTLDASVNQRWDNTGVAVGFTAQQRLGVTVRRPEAVGAILEAAAARLGNALLVDQVRLDVADRSPGLVKAREAAFADAKDKAEQYAALSGVSLGAVLAVVESGSAPGPMPKGLRMASAMADSPRMPVESGELDLTASVTVTWELS